jgi:hypothetical protein
MITHSFRSWSLAAAISFLAACGGSSAQEPAPPAATPAGAAAAPPPAPSGGSAYEGQGFVVHEWGTNTVVAGSDGRLVRGLHHEEESLPSFVYDRMRGATRLGPEAVQKFDCNTKLETPVTYFYSPEPRRVRVSVDYPKGVYTQWFPAVGAFYPLVAEPCSAPGTLGDPVLDPKFGFVMEECRQKYSAVGGGLLDWGEVEILARDADVEALLPPAPLDEFTWSHARAVAANPVRVQAPGGEAETERFLFYRGLGNDELPIVVRGAGAGGVELENLDPEHPVGPVFVLNVGEERAGFRLHAGGVPAATRVELPGLGVLESEASIAEYEEALGRAIAEALEGSGLYRDEALGMVDTWKRQWFRTPGVRVLYLLPQAVTERLIPLSITPAPDRLVRTLVVRVELISPDREKADVDALAKLAGSEQERAAAEAHFLALGRFAEPRLRRAIALSGGTPGAEVLLGQVAGASTLHALGE